MALQPLRPGGLAALFADEQIPFDQALTASDLYLDALTFQGRNGYRGAVASAPGSGTTQGLWRFRPSGTGSSTVRTVAVRGGRVWTIADPSSETAIDGASTDQGSQFGSGALVSGAQLGKYLYLGSDDSAVAWRRVKPDFTVEAVAGLPKPAAAAAAAGSLTLVKFSSLSAPTTAGGATYGASSVTDWQDVGGTIGGTVTFDLGTTYDWSSTKWLFVAATPHTQGDGGGIFRIEVATAAGAFETLTDVYDTPGDDSPYVVYCSLVGLTSTTRAAVKRIRFTQVSVASTYSVHAFMPVPSAPAPGEVIYYVTHYNSSTGQESLLSDKTTVVYSSDGITFPQFHGARQHYTALVDLGTGVSSNPDSLDAASLFNKSGGKAFPVASDFAAIRTFTGSLPAAAQYPLADTVRLWRVCTNGIRLVKAYIYSSGTTYSITDDVGEATLSHQSYVAGGAPPACTAMAAVNGRLIALYENRVFISSYVPFAQTTDPFPQFPDVAVLDADGWSFDIAPTAAEQGLWTGNGDRSAYILTNEACYVMTDLRPNSIPYKVFERGVISRRGACWAEEACFWAAHDGIYMARNRSGVTELTEPIRQYYRGTFAPDSTTVMGYQDRKLICVKGTAMLRYDFVTKTWTTHTLAHGMNHAAFWRDPTGTYQQLWFYEGSGGNIFRWQPGKSTGDANRATTDGGTSLPAWVYSTGFAVEGSKSRIRSLFLDTTGSVTANAYKDATSSPTVSRTFSSGEHQLAFAPSTTAYKWRLSFTAANTVGVRRAMWERDVIAGEGA